MKTIELERLTELTLVLATAFNREADEPLFEAYRLGLSDLSAADVGRAVGAALRGCRFMPSVAELRELAGVVSPEQRAVIAWQAVSKASNGGFYDTVDFDDPVCNAAVRNLGGWAYLTTIPDPKEFESFVRQRFEKAYVALYRHGISAEQAAPLLGHTDQVNVAAGYEPRKVLRIETGLPPAQIRIGQRHSGLGINAQLKRLEAA